jgi:hypothetical protein
VKEQWQQQLRKEISNRLLRYGQFQVAIEVQFLAPWLLEPYPSHPTSTTFFSGARRFVHEA